jgi:hypothetical protein
VNRLGYESEKELLPEKKAVSVVVSVGLGNRCAVLPVGARCQVRNSPRIKRFSLCCILVREAAKWLAGILSPQRLPFRHPGRADKKK